MTLLTTLPPSVIYPDSIHERDGEQPVAHIPLSFLPTRALCGAPLANVDPEHADFVRCTDCEQLWADEC